MFYFLCAINNQIAPKENQKLYWNVQITVTARSKAWVCSRSHAETAGSNPAVSMDVSVVSVVCCHVEVSATG